jgi:hypothetical protein
MRWGTRWGQSHIEKGFKHYTFWGGDHVYNAGRIEVRKVRTRIVPCENCRRVATCAMYQSFTRTRLHGEYSHGTNILHMCDIFLPSNSPGSPHASNPHGRTSGIEPK